MEEMFRDKLAVGIKDTTLSQLLQLEPDLMLGKAKKAVRQKVAVHEHQQVLRERRVGNTLLKLNNAV